MEVSSGTSTRRHHADSEIEHFEIESNHNHNVQHDHHFRSTSMLEILDEVIRIFRYNLTGFTYMTALLLFPLSAILLSNVLVNQSLVNKLNIKLFVIAQSCGVPLNYVVKQLCHKFSETIVSSIMCFPLSITLSLLSRSAIIYSVDCTYAKKIFDTGKFYEFFTEIWRRLLYTYLCVCVVIVSCFTLFLAFIVTLSGSLLELGFAPSFIIYPVILISLIFCVVFANALLICNVAIVISVLENVSGFEALLRSRDLVKGQTQLGISLILLSALCMAFVEGLFDHRVKTVSYGDGSSRLWEGPLLVSMYAFVLLIDEMVRSVFYFSCKAYLAEGSDEECEPVLAEMSQL